MNEWITVIALVVMAAFAVAFIASRKVTPRPAKPARYYDSGPYRPLSHVRIVPRDDETP